MNYITIFMKTFLLCYIMYVYHETYLQHYHKDMRMITRYQGLLGCMFMAAILLPINMYSLLLGVSILFAPCYMYWKEERHLMLYVSYIAFLLSAASIVLVCQWIAGIQDSVWLGFDENSVNLFSNMIIIASLYLLKRRNLPYEQSYTDIVSVGLLSLSFLDGYLYAAQVFPQGSYVYLFPDLITFMFLLFYRCAFNMEIGKEKVLELTKVRYANKENNEKFESLQKENQMIMQQMHDMKKHLAILESLGNDDQEFDSYKKEIEHRAQELLCTRQTGNPFIDHILHTYQQRFQIQRIQCNVEMEQEDLSMIDSVDVCALLANLLDNAVESCEKCGERFILLKIKQQGDLLIFKMKNSCLRIQEEKGNLISTKNDQVLHGYGMYNMQLIANKYHGNLTYRFDEQHQIFITAITLHT